jgi:hypothetical protein
MAKRHLSGIPFIDRFKAKRAISKAKKQVKKVDRAVKDARDAIDRAKDKADVTDRVSIVNSASEVERNLDTMLCPRGAGGGEGGDPCKEVKADCRKKVHANIKGPVSSKFKGAYDACVEAQDCEP